MGTPTTVQLDNFYGVRENQSGDLTLKDGELAKCTNCRITDNFKIQKRDGYEEIFATGNGGQIQGMYYGKVNGTKVFLFARDGNVFQGDLTTGGTTITFEFFNLNFKEASLPIATVTFGSVKGGAHGQGGLPVGKSMRILIYSRASVGRESSVSM